jgi:hypothetical protein
MLYQSDDYLFNRVPSGIINPYNFAINGRIFDPTDTRSLFPPITSLGTQFSGTPVITS